jgi:rare lipoprotein A (peptidoglycan hydrolase)
MRLFLIGVFCCGVMASLAVRVEGVSCSSVCKAHWISKMPKAQASWYYDAGGTACGFHRKYGVAHKTLPCGTAVRMCKQRCVTAVVQDRGPFIAGREFDLNPALKGALGCGDICTLHYRVLEEHP